MDSLKLGGRVTFDGKLDVVVAKRHLGRRELESIKYAHEKSSVPFVVLQVDNLDVVQNYFMSGKWIKPKQETKLIDGIRAIASHLGIEINLSPIVLDCINFGVFDK